MSVSVKSCKTTCPYCGVGCGVIATPNDEGTVQIEGDIDHPSNFGRLCSKGAALGETLGPENRLLWPTVGGHEVSWDAATSLIARKFEKTIAEHGPDAVAFYVSGQILTEDYYVANKLMKGFIGSANIDTNSRLCMASSVAGHKRAFGSDTVPGNYEDLELADLLILVGSNLAWCHPVLFQRIKAAKENRPDMKIVLIDPRKTMTAEIADLWLPICPDGDTELFNGLLAYLADRASLDYDYINRFTNGFEGLVQELGSISLGTVSKQTSIRKQDLERFFSWFAETEKTVTVFSQGVNQSVSGTDKVNAIINCHLATGRIGKPGTGPFSVTGQPNAMGGREVGGLANMLAAHMNIENKTHRSRVQGFWKSPTIADKVGLKAVDMFEAVRSGQIKALWIMATNPVDSLPMADQVAEALEICPFVVVSEIYENTDTVKYADVVLPSLGWGEKDGTVTNSERRISRQRAFLTGPENAKADWWQMAAVAKEMGFADEFSYSSSADIFREHAALSALENDGERTFDIGGCASLSDAEFDNLSPFQWPWREGRAQSERRFFAKGNFQTSLNQAQFVKTQPALRSLNKHSEHLILNTGRVRDHWHTMTRTARSERLSRHIGEPFCEISPADAAQFSIKDADLVELSSDFGSILVRALVTDRVCSGSVFVPIHWADQFASNARVAKLIPSVVDPISGQPASKNSPVSIRPVSMASHAYVLSKEKPRLFSTDYWAVSKVSGGWQIECACLEPVRDMDLFLEKLGVEIKTGDVLDYGDLKNGDLRRAVFANDQLSLFVKIASEPVVVSRSWVIAQLGEEFPNRTDRLKIMSGRPAKDVPDKGAIVCSCLSVGALEITDAVQKGCHSVSEVGSRLKAGTSCGSCRSEIQMLINQNIILAAE